MQAHSREVWPSLWLLLSPLRLTSAVAHRSSLAVCANTLRAMTTWEYLTAPLLIHNTKAILDNFGADGWELVQIVPGPNPESLVAYFKRPRP